jgi:pyridoxine/pyridoxamine 5'-phosphate oxidase
MADLHAVLATAFGLLAEGASNPKSAWRNPALATSDGQSPGIRTIVLRRFSPDERVVELHTDARSPKLAALTRNPRAALHGWDADRRIQLRLDGVVEVAPEPQTQAAWDALPDGSRATYQVSQAPGTPIADPAEALGTLSIAQARAEFRVLWLRFDALEYLSLAHGSHHRASFVWQGGPVAATWLVP